MRSEWSRWIVQRVSLKFLMNEPVSRVLLVFGFSLGFSFGFLSDAFAAGKRRISEANSPTASADSATLSAAKTSHPFRAVQLKPVGTRVFSLPNGSRVDLQSDLDVMFSTVLTEYSRFLPLEAGSEDPACSTRLEARASITTLELKVAQIGLKFGYSPSGETQIPISNLTGRTAVNIGTVAMDFGIWQCQGSRCVEIMATTASHATAGVELGLTVDFSEVTTGTSLLYNTPLGNALRKILVEGVKKLASHTRTPKLSWYATVREVNPDVGSVLFDAGTQAGIKEGEGFEVYARTPGLSSCDVYRAVARISTERTDARGSIGIIDELLDTRGIQEGDIVLVREMPTSKQ